jgi:hypothetical protein
MGLLTKSSVFTKMHSGKNFESIEDVQRFEKRLATELEKGTVERIPVGQLLSHVTPEEWYRERKTGIVYRYSPPEFPLKGRWEHVEDPEARSFFEQLYPGDAPTPEEYSVLVRELEALWRRGEVERAPDVNTPLKGVVLYHHPATDETFELTPPGELEENAMWIKIFRSRKDGSWPGKLKLDMPPARRGA